MRVLVIGEGLLGGAVRRALPGAVGVRVAIPWAGGDAAIRDAVAAEVGEHVRVPGRWGLAWCAGAGVVGTAADGFRSESVGLHAALTALDVGSAERGALFVASSAGGAWGEGSAAVLDEGVPPSPSSDYGWAKVHLEEAALLRGGELGLQVLVGRLSNLYGSGQDLRKPQGFVSHLMQSMLVHQPFTLSVPGETQRDFLHVDDAAGRVAAWFTGPAQVGGGPQQAMKVLAAGRTHSLLRVISLVRAAAGVQPKVVMATNPASALQPRFVRLASHVLPELDRAVPARSLEIGLKQTWTEMLRAHAAGDGVRSSC